MNYRDIIFITKDYSIKVDGVDTHCAHNKEKREVDIWFKGMTPDGIQEDERSFPMMPGLWIIRPIWLKNKLEYWTDRVQ